MNVWNTQTPRKPIHHGSCCHGESSKDLTQFMKIRFRSFLWVCVPWQSKIFDFVLHFIFQLAVAKKKATSQPPGRGVSRITLAI